MSAFQSNVIDGVQLCPWKVGCRNAGVHPVLYLDGSTVEDLLVCDVHRRQAETLFAEAYAKTTAVEYVVQGNYGHGWEDLTAEDDRAEARQRMREYDENEPQYRHRVVSKPVED